VYLQHDAVHRAPFTTTSIEEGIPRRQRPTAPGAGAKSPLWVYKRDGTRRIAVNDQRDGTDEAGEPGGTPDPVDVASRAEGRPPEERSSEDATAQAEAILQDSEDRIAKGAEDREI
jgi:hypothetical protein